MKKEFKPLTWKVKNYCCNTDNFVDYVWNYRHKYQRTKKTEDKV